MKQQINLINHAVNAPQEQFTLKNLSIATASVLMLIVGYYGYTFNKLAESQRQQTRITAELEKSEAQMKQMTDAKATSVVSPALSQQISALEQKVKSGRSVLEIARQRHDVAADSYASIMRAFASQGVDGVWLTGFSLNSETNSMNVSGRSTNAALVPKYISKLGSHDAFSGRTFEAINISQSTYAAKTTGKNLALMGDQNKELSYVEFRLESAATNAVDGE